MGKQPALGSLVCDYCDRKVRKVHPWQKCCGRHECRLASKRKYHGVTFTCDACGVDAQKKRSNQRFCSSAACQKVSKQGKRRPKVEVTCPYCGTTVVARNTRQVTCLSGPCKKAHEKTVRNRTREKKRTGETFKCSYCPKVIERIQDNQITCGAPECRKARKKDRDDESFWLKRRRAPVICEVCDREIRVKRFRLHPACSRRLANDKRRLERNRHKLTAAKAASYRLKSPPPQRDRVSPRMEELKCVNKLRRTS